MSFFENASVKYFMDGKEIDKTTASELESELNGFSYGQECALSDAIQWFSKKPDLSEIFKLYDKVDNLYENLKNNINKNEVEDNIDKTRIEIYKKINEIINDNLKKSAFSSHLNNDSIFYKSAIKGYKDIWNQYFYITYLAEVKPEVLEARKKEAENEYNENFIEIEPVEVIEEEIIPVIENDEEDSYTR